MIVPRFDAILVSVRSEERAYKVKEGVDKGMEKTFRQTIADVMVAGEGVASIRCRDGAEKAVTSGQVKSGSKIRVLLSGFSVERGVGQYDASAVEVL